MCGICGAWMPAGAPRIEEDRIRRMRDSMLHRGPDDAGHWVSPDGRVALGSRRLSIIDLSPAGRQPMWNEDRTVGIVFNGECYNFRELRDWLVSRGRRFRSQTDTESVLGLYEELGDVEEVLRRLRGMYGLAIWDGPRQRLLLARDRMGIKPLYYSRQGGGLLFASEVRALLASGLVSRELDPAGVQGYFAFGSSPVPQTPLAAVAALPPAHYLLIEKGREKIAPYWTLSFEAKGKESEHLEQVRAELIDSVRRQLVSDRPVGIFLSGGIDSSALVALARHVEHRKLRTYSVIFSESSFNEAPFSRRVAELFETDHHEYLVSGSDVLRQLDTMVASLDLPSIDGMNTYLVSQATHSDGTVVALSGLGSDEIFFGYPSFRAVPRLSTFVGRVPRVLGHAIERGSRYFPPGSRAARLAGLPGASHPIPAAYFAFRGLLEESFLKDLFRPEFSNGSRFDAVGYLDGLGSLPADPANAVSALELRAYMHNQLLRDSDAMSMAHSIELRVPLIDHPLVELAAGLPSASKQPAGRNKDLLLKALPTALPEECWKRAKQTFTLPFAHWLKKELRNEAEAVLVSENSALRRLCRPEALQRIWDGFVADRVHWSRVWLAVVFARWTQQLSIK